MTGTIRYSSTPENKKGRSDVTLKWDWKSFKSEKAQLNKNLIKESIRYYS